MRGTKYVPKWTATIIYLAIWGVSGAFAAVFAGAWSVVVLPILWLWVIFNLVQVWRGNRKRLWS